MVRPLWIVLALVLTACTGKGPARQADDWEVDQDPPPQIDPRDAVLEPGVLLAVDWDSGISGAGISEKMVVRDDGVVRYVASRARQKQVYRSRLTDEQLAALRRIVDSAEFAALDGLYPARQGVHDAGMDRLIVAAPAGTRQIRYNEAFGTLPPLLKEVLAIVAAAHARFEPVNPWHAIQ